jgi:serine/threonine protein kinase
MSLENSVVLGRYRVLWLVDAKRLIKTYIARDEHEDAVGTPVLIKQYLHDLGQRHSPRMGVLFEELSGLTHLRHAGVVSLLDYGSVGESLVMAYAHLPGVDLPQLCEQLGRRQQTFPEHLAVYTVRRLLQTLHHCHTRELGSLVHGRITIGCVHLPAVGEPQVADFGVARLEDVAAEAESQIGIFQTRMSYAAPELTRGGVPTLQGDTYSVALLLYRLLSGTNPFRGRSISETLQRVLQLPPAPLHMPDWDQCGKANAILMRALAKDPAVRHQSCLELSDDLAALQGESDERLADELSSLVRNNSSADWAHIARLTQAVRKSIPPRRAAAIESLPSVMPFESNTPAFVSGLLTDQPLSVGEHTLREAREKRRRRRQWVMLPTVLIPAAAILFGLYLGRLGGAGVSASHVAASAGAESSRQLVNGSVAELRSKLRRCVDPSEERALTSKVELEFGAPGELAGVRLNPSELAHTRLGACLLETAWDTQVSAPGAMSLVISLASDE